MTNLKRVLQNLRPQIRTRCHINWLCLYTTLSAILPLFATADAIVTPQAMFAETIAEYYVEEGRVRLELEIGQGDIGSFRNVLPDELYQRLGFGDVPLQERLPLFLQRDVAILYNGEPLAGAIQKMAPTTRPLRDRITGEELPTSEEDATLVIGLTAIFPIEGQPEHLTLMAPRETGLASIGFVLYHRGVPVNDFRFLSSGYEVKLDWEDPWYSAFPQRSLRRQYDSPMSGFLYIEPYEVRREIIIRPHDLARMTDLGLEGQDVIRADQQDAVKARIVEFLQPYFDVTIDGEPVEGALNRVNFLRRTLKNSTVIDNQDVELLSATVGIIHVYPTDGLPQEVEMNWGLFTEKMNRVAAATVDQAGPLPTFLEPDFNVLRWENFLKNPEIPSLVELLTPPTAMQKAASWGWWVGLILCIGLAFSMARKGKAGGTLSVPMLGSLVLALALTAFLVHAHFTTRMDDVKARQLVGDLLHNVYRAFDYRGDEVIYDVLARSVDGDLLTDVYLETRRGLELANQGGARVKVREVEVTETELLESDSRTIRLDSRWNVAGSVGHWGHVHERKNGYRAALEISEVDGTWKLSGLEILEEERL